MTPTQLAFLERDATREAEKLYPFKPELPRSGERNAFCAGAMWAATRPRTTSGIVRCVDLIYVTTDHERTMSISIIDKPGNSKLLGPVPASEAFGPLSKMLAADRPSDFPTESDANNYLMGVHIENLTAEKNSFGIPYPFTGGNFFPLASKS